MENLVYIVFFLLVVPICVLLHEIGHGIGVVITSSSPVHIYLGTKNEKNKENFNFGRMHFHIQWSYIGFAYWSKDLSKWQKASALAGGPIMSLLLTAVFGYLSFFEFGNMLRQLFGWAAIYNVFQFLSTIIPIKYPRWMGSYSGFSSDGLQLIQVLKK